MATKLTYYSKSRYNNSYWKMVVDGMYQHRSESLDDIVPAIYEPIYYASFLHYKTTNTVEIECLDGNFKLVNSNLIEAIDVVHDINLTGINVFVFYGTLFYASKPMSQAELECVKYYKWGYQTTTSGGTNVSKYGRTIDLVTKLKDEPEFEMDAFIMSKNGTTLYYGEEKVHTNIRTLTGLIKKYSKK